VLGLNIGVVRKDGKKTRVRALRGGGCLGRPPKESLLLHPFGTKKYLLPVKRGRNPDRARTVSSHHPFSELQARKGDRQ